MLVETQFKKCQCKVMLGRVLTILFSPTNLFTYNASKIVNIGSQSFVLHNTGGAIYDPQCALNTKEMATFFLYDV